jgi:hypothetical protein
MKKQIYLSLLIGLLMFTTTSKSHAESYLGDFCWQVTENETPVWIYKFGVYEKEGVHYALYGTGDDGNGGIAAANGNAEVVGSNIMMTIVGSGIDEQIGAWNETFSAVLSISTLSGTWHNMGAVYDNIGSPQAPYHTNGTIALITCP